MFKAHKFSISNRARLGLFGLDKSSSQVTDMEGSVNFMKFNGVPSCRTLAQTSVLVRPAMGPRRLGWP